MSTPRKETILSTLKRVVYELTGIGEDAIDVNANFIETGVDSLMLIQAVQMMQDTLGVKLSVVQVMEELTSLDLVAAYIDERLPPQEVPAAETIPNASPEIDTMPALSYPSPPFPENGSHDQEPEWSIPSTGLDQIVAQQLQVMSQQLEMLRGGTVTAPEPVTSATTAVAAPATVSPKPETVPVTAVKGITPELFNPYQPIDPGSKGGLTPRQQQHLDALIAKYTQRTKESKRVTQTYRPYLADSRASANFKLRWKEMVYPIVGAGSRGSHLWDVDGNEYVDVTMGFGLHLLGHSPDFVVEAMEKQLKQGIELGPQIYLAGKVCQLISELTGVERVNICNSGTEAVMGALRVARTITRRNKIALFAGSYHGWSDGTQARPLTIGGKHKTVPNAPGVQPQAVEDVMVLDWDNPKSLETLKEHVHELAAVLVEPVQSRRPDIQPREFLHELRRLTEQAGTALIFDEMVTGFRIGIGGAQEFFGVKADLVIYGKVLGAGLPLGVVAGKAAYMDAFDGGMWNYGDASYPPTEKTLFAGAYFKHPLTMAAAWAILNHLKNNPELLPQLNQKTTRLVNALNDYFQQSQLPIYAGQFGSIFRLLYPRDFKHMDLFFYHVMDNGLFLWEGRNCFLSTAHTDEDVEFIIAAIKKSVEQMREGGFFPELTTPSPGTQHSTASALSSNGRSNERSNGRGNLPGTQSNTLVEIIRQADESAPARAESSTVKPKHVAGKAVQFSLYYFGNYESEFSSDKYDLLIHGARFGDRHGFSAVWVPERHFHSFGGISPNPSVVAAAIARETEHISIRAGSVVLPLHNPIRVAEEWSVVDNLSHGRVGVSFASGWNPNDFAFAPDSYERRREVMYDGIETVQKLWRGEMVQVRSGTGKEISVKLSPMPMQAALPTWVTGAHDGTFIKAGEIGANFLTNLSDQSIEEMARKIALYRTARANKGHDPQAGQVTVLVHTFVLDDAQQARVRAHDPFLRYLKSSLGLTVKGKVQMNVDQLSPEDLNHILESGFERHLKTGALIGTPEQCVPIVDRLIESGVNEIGCLIDFGVDTPSVLDSLQYLNVLRAKYEKPDAGAAAENVQTIEVRSPSPENIAESIDNWLATQVDEDAYDESLTMQFRGPAGDKRQRREL
jgi:natural product biosynthesis luciferase-like monooxygenase protein